ncbi:hypothetical protein BKA56DRAFT_670829 [Ilyonectria sp. MPI-CAGE-AT-0026]|nr:hypothetical protein BKA56DRAFT_670829 [Ilyonectria sp. MPI-CAGE-AT-0026]
MELGRCRVFSHTAGVRISPLALGAMSLSSVWPDFIGSVEEEKSFQLVDASADAGGNFIDAANNYQDERSDEYNGKLMAARGIFIICSSRPSSLASIASGN